MASRPHTERMFFWVAMEAWHQMLLRNRKRADSVELRRRFLELHLLA